MNRRCLSDVLGNDQPHGLCRKPLYALSVASVNNSQEPHHDRRRDLLDRLHSHDTEAMQRGGRITLNALVTQNVKSVDSFVKPLSSTRV